MDRLAKIRLQQVRETESFTVPLQIRTLGSKALHRERVESVLASWEWR